MSAGMDALQRVMTTFKQFERKLDKIQADVNFHGHTLSDLKSILTNLPAISHHDAKVEFTKPTIKKSTASQYEDNKKRGGDEKRTKRNSIIQPITTVVKGPMAEIRETKQPNNKPIVLARRGSPKQNYRKSSSRPRKSEGQRKNNSLKIKKGDKKTLVI